MSIPFLANSTTFTNALMQAKRASQLRGIPFSTRDVMNLQSGYMEGAAERTAGERSATLAEKAQTAQEKNWADTLAQEKELAGLSRTQAAQLTGMQMDAQKSAANKALTGNIASTALGLGGMAILMAPKAAAGLTTTVGGPGLYGFAPPAAAPAMLSYAAPAAAGFVGAELGNKIAQPAGELINMGGESERGFVGKVGGGAAAGAGVGMIGGPLAPVTVPIGAAIGGTVGLLDWGFDEGKHAVQDVVDFFTSW